MLAGCSNNTTSSASSAVSSSEAEESQGSAEGTSSVTDANPDAASYGETVTIEGYLFNAEDSATTPVTVTVAVTSVVTGQDAVDRFSTADVAKPEEGMEYIVIDLDVTYKDGDAASIEMTESSDTMTETLLYFNLAEYPGVLAEDLSNLLTDNIYGQTIGKGDTVTGSVAFLHPVDRNDVLMFSGFGSSIKLKVR